MREILFRGQTRRKGEKVRMDGSPVASNWVYGGVLCGSGDHSIIYQTDPDIEKKVVYTDTLGQFTGLTDKNGVRIFEGDIVKCVSKLNYANMIVIFEDGEFRMVKCEDYKTYTAGNGYFSVRCFHKEVIGNIYDTPELLGGENDDQ